MYLALYRKWRPKVFSDVVSQEHITRILQNQVKQGRTAHAYLFTGSRGTGKTTCSKILAKAVNCLHPVDGNPCLECEVCRGIESGAILDVTEMDAASNNGVDDIRDLRDEAGYTPTVCRYRVYIIDEVHMLSVSAFNALLKIMEEPPPHVLFILATTEVHKVPATIVSRCQQYDFRRIRPADIAARLTQVAEGESFTLTEDAARLIARLADGGMRDALSLLDQCAAFSQEIDLDVVARTAGIAGSDALFSLSDAILRQDAAAALQQVQQLYDNAKGIDRLTAELIAHFRDVLLCRSVTDPAELVPRLPAELEKLKAQAAAVSLDRVLEILSLLQSCADQLSRSVNKKVELEMTVIRLCSPSATTNPPEKQAPAAPAGLAERLERLEQLVQTTAVSRPEPVRRSRPAPAPEPVQPSGLAVSQPSGLAVSQPLDNAAPLPQWQELLAELSAKDPALFVLLQDSTAVRSGQVVIIQSPNPMLKSLLLTDNIGARLADLVEEKLGSRHRLRIARKEQTEAFAAASALDDILQKATAQEVEIQLKD